MTKKYFIAVRGADTWMFPTEKARTDFISDIEKIYPNIEYVTSETEMGG